MRSKRNLRGAVRRLAVAGAVAATLVGAGLGAAGPAMADPPSTPSLTTLVGVGSATPDPLFDEGGTTTNDPGCTSSTPGDAGTFVTDYNATNPAFPVASWDAVNPCTGVADETITTKALNSSDTSCQLERPDGSAAGIAMLNDNQTDTNTVSGQSAIYCIDYARTVNPPNLTTREDAFVALAQDGLDWSYPKLKGKTNPQPASLTYDDLVAIYTCTVPAVGSYPANNWADLGGKNAPIGVVVPQSGSGTRTRWLEALGMIPPPASEPCWQNGTVVVKKVADVIGDSTGLSGGNVAQFTKTQTFGTPPETIPPQDDIFPYSIGDWIAQGELTDGVGGHATSIWGHGNLHLGEIENVAGTKALTAVTKNSAGQPRINPAWNPLFSYTLYAVTRNGCYSAADPTSTAVCLPSLTGGYPGPAPAYEVNGLAKFIHWACHNATARADIASYGFTNLSAKTFETCGTLTAGD